mgnify:FL=1
MIKHEVAFFTDTYLPAIDGVVTSILSFKSELPKYGYKVTLYAPSNSVSFKKSNDTILFPSIKFKPYPQYRIAIFPFYSFIKNKADIIHAHTPYMMGLTALINARIHDIPFVCSFHTWVNDKSIIENYYPNNKYIKNVTSKYLWEYTKYFYKKCDAVIAPSNTVKLELEKHGINNIYVIPNGVDLSIFNYKLDGSLIRLRYGLNESDKLILYVGRLSYEKKIDVMLKAIAILYKKEKNIKVIIGGTGPAEQYYKKLSEKLGIQKIVRFIGFVPQNILPYLYAAADVFCMPSTFETQGIVVLEAMALGKPVVGADYMALHELIIDHKNGLKFKPNDPLDCSRKLMEILKNTEVYKNNCIMTARKFSKGNVTKLLVDLYEKLLKGDIPGRE